MKKRCATLVISLLITFSSIVSTLSLPTYRSVQAATDYNVYYNQFRNALLDQCVTYQETLANDTGSKQYGLLYSLKILSQYSMYVEFCTRHYKILGIASSTLSALESDLHTAQSEFNKKYGKNNKGIGFTEMTKDLKNSFVGISRKPSQKKYARHSVARADIRTNLVNRIPDYINKLLKQVDAEVKKVGSDSEKKSAVESQNLTLLTNVYSVYVGMLNTESDLKSYTPFDNDKQKAYNVFCSSSSGKKTYMRDRLKDAVKDYDYLMRLAKSSYSEEIEDDIDCDLSKEYIENLSNAVVRNKKTYYPKDISLSRLYYAILSASSVYVPFQSYAGNSEFQHALKSLTNDKTIQSNMIEFYSAVKDLRKPLYKREFDDKGYPSGKATLLTIHDFLDEINKNKSGALVTALGNFVYDGTNGSWTYVQDDARTTVDFDYDSTTENAKSEIADSTTDTFDGSAISTNPVSTTAPSSTPKLAGLANLSKLFTVFQAKHATAATAAPESKSSAAPVETNVPTETNTPTESTTSPKHVTDSDDSVLDDVSGESTDTNSNVDVQATLNESIYAYKEITDETKISEPVYMYGYDYTRTADNTTAMLFKNIVKSCANLSSIKSKNTRYVYVNAFGDIVTDDNLVLVPGVANPILYKSKSSYYPYTAAFMNTYPQPFQKNSTFRLTNKNDVGKYLIVRQKLLKPSSDTSGDTKQFAVLTDSIDSIKSNSPLSIMEMNTEFKLKGQEIHKPLKYNRLLFKSSKTWKKNKTHEYTPLVYSDTIQIENKTIFPYVPSEDTGYTVADTIAGAMYVYLVQDETKLTSNTKTQLNENYILHNIIASGLQGTNNPKGYSTSVIQQIEQQLDANEDIVKDKVVTLSRTIFNTTSNVRGVIGLRDCLQNPVVGRILVVCRSNIFIFFFIIALILLYSFSRMHLDLFQVIVKSAVSMLLAFLMITVLPTYLPMFFNMVINNVSETLSYKTLAIQIENESIGNVKTNSVKSDGERDFTSGSLTLYRAGSLNWKSFLEQVNCDDTDLVGGNYETLSSESGFFAEGDALKVNTSILFDTLKIEDECKVSEGTSLHYLKAYKTVTNNVDYYTPYYSIVDSFISRMNSLEQISGIPRSTITYANGTIKDNFLVHSYVNSSAFLTPGKYGIKIPEDSDADDSTNNKMQDDANSYAKAMEKVFGDKYVATDFLGLSSWLLQPSAAMKKTLWFKTMQDQGYYDRIGKCPENSRYKRKMNKLISYVNYHTRKFIFDVDDQIGRLSDDTMTKIIALRALVAFTQEVSDFGDWLYPYSLNYGEMSLSDIVQTAFISDYNMYTACDLDVISYIAESRGWFNLIVFDLVLICLFVVINVVQWLVYLMYLALCIVLIIKVLQQGETSAPVKGFLKCSVILMFAYTALAITFSLVQKANGNAFAIYAIFLVLIVVSYLITMVVTSLIADKADLGNNAINAKFASLGGGSLRNLRQTVANFIASSFRAAKTGAYNRRHDGETIRHDDAFDKYRYDADIDDFSQVEAPFDNLSYSGVTRPVQDSSDDLQRDANGFVDDLVTHEDPIEFIDDIGLESDSNSNRNIIFKDNLND